MKEVRALHCFIFLVTACTLSHTLYNGNSFTRRVLNSIMTGNCERVPLHIQLSCFMRRYRTFDGTCNNLCNITKGSAMRPFSRMLPPAYQDGEQAPRSLGSDNQPLPNARNVSTIVFVSSTGNDDNTTTANFTHMTMTWGQFLDHDITSTQANESAHCGNNSTPCRGPEEGCISIEILQGNQLKDNISVVCIPLRRSAIRNGQQINTLSSFIDGSQVYGANCEEAERLRDRKANLGLLRVVQFPSSSAKPPILPEASSEAFCRSPNSARRPCFRAGDKRVNENPALIAMHTVWVREHNRIAKYLHVLNPTWCDKKLFQEARKIVIAELQHITYNEWLPVFFNKELRKQANILLEPVGKFFNGYDPTVNPEIPNAFATAALRVGHTLIREDFGQFNRQFQHRGFIPMKTFFDPSPLYSFSGNGMGGILLGLVTQASQNVDRFFTPAVRENLVAEGPPVSSFVGDLSAINIQRGRDHGLPSYNHFRMACGLGKAEAIDNFTNINAAQRERIRVAYNDNVDDVDLFVGGISETPLPGSILGATFTCILVKGFENLRVGDRFWYERNDSHTGFTMGQLNAMRNATLARVLCDNSDGIERITPNVFLERSAVNDLTNCYKLNVVNLNEWKEEPGRKKSCKYGTDAGDAKTPQDQELSNASVSV